MAKLQAMGHKVNAGEGTWGNLQTVMWDKRANTLSGGTDPRNEVGQADVLLSERRRPPRDGAAAMRCSRLRRMGNGPVLRTGETGQ